MGERFDGCVFLQGHRRVTVAAAGATPPGRRVEFADTADARAFLRGLESGAMIPVLPPLLSLLPFAVVPIDGEGLRATIAHALVTGGLRAWITAADEVGIAGGGGPNPGGGGTTPVTPTGRGDARVTARATPAALWVLESSMAGADDAGNAFEGSTFAVTARLVEGTSTDTDGTLAVLAHDGASLATEAFDPRQGTHRWEHVTTTLADDETRRRVRAALTLPTDAQQGHEDFTLWPRTVTLRVKHRDTAQPLAGFTFVVAQPGGTTAQGRTDATGEVVVTLPKAAPFEVRAEAPSEITSWVDDAGRVREARGVTAFKAVIVEPAKPASGSVRRQYVNLASADGGKDGNGHAVRGVVRGEAPAKEGDAVHVRVRFGRQSQRNAPAPAVTGLADAAVDGRGLHVTGHVVLDAALGAHFDLDLGLAGGDTCDVAVGGTRAARDETRSLQNWRKLLYQVTRPSTMATPSLALMTASLAKVFIEYEKYDEVVFDEADAGTPPGSWFDGADFGLAGRVVNIGDHNKAWFHQKFHDTKFPVGVHVLFCHAQFDGGVPANKTAYTANIAAATPKIAFPGGGTVYGHVKQLDGHVFPKAFQDGLDSVRAVTWTSLAASGPEAGKSGTIGAADIHVDWNTAHHRVSIRLPASAVAVVDAGASVRISATALWSNGEYLGESDGARGNLQLIRNSTKDAAQQTNAVMAHELGHTMFMVLAVVPPGTDAGAHGWKYEARGHIGPHCAFGVAPDLFASTKNLAGSRGSCVMFGEAGATAPTDFCARCTPFVNAQDLTKIAPVRSP